MGFYLLWGGSVWAPVAVMIGLGLVGLLIVRVLPLLGAIWTRRWPFCWRWCGFWTRWLDWCWRAVAAATAPVGSAGGHAARSGWTAIDSDLFGGFLLSFVIGVTAISASLPIGILLALGRQSDMPLIKYAVASASSNSSAACR